MKLASFDRKIAIAYIKTVCPIGREIFDQVRSGSHVVSKYSVFEVNSDQDQVAEFDPEYEEYCFDVKRPGKYSPEYKISDVYKKYVENYFRTKISNKPKTTTSVKYHTWYNKMKAFGFTHKEITTLL